jgi:hypothetical protein
VGSQRHILAALTPGKRPSAHCIGGWWAPGPVWTGMENLVPPEFDPWTVNHEGTAKDFRHSHTIKDAVFHIACAWNTVRAKTLRQDWRKLWPAVMIAEAALDREDFARFNVHDRDTVHEKVLMFKKLDLSNPEYEESQVGVEEWISPAKGIVVSHIP